MFIAEAGLEDAEEILVLQKLAYLSEAELNQDYTIPPLTQTLEGIQQQFETHLFLKAMVDGRIVGSVRAHQAAGTCYIGRLIVHPDFQNRGIGTRLMAEIESRFDGAQRYELFTSERSERNLYLYQKLGYRTVRREQLTEKVTLLYLEKTMPTGS
jgi:ribosomal protein S18 acetylase RimI-like enzyme